MPKIPRSIAGLTLVMLAWLPHAARAQSQSPLQEWQYDGGIVLARLFEPNLPAWRIIAGAAAEVQPAYDGARAYRVSGGPVINVYYRDVAFFSTGEGLGYNFLRGDHYQIGIGLTYDLGREEKWMAPICTAWATSRPHRSANSTAPGCCRGDFP